MTAASGAGVAARYARSARNPPQILPYNAPTASQTGNAMHWGRLAALAALALPLTNVCAAEAANPSGVAVIIGNRHYEGTIPEVAYAHRDAEAFKRYVLDELGYDPENVIDLRDATQSQMEATFGNEASVEGNLWSFLDPAGGSDVLVFYSGHGVPGQRDGKGYLLPTDADPNVPELNAYAIDLLYANLAKLEGTGSVAVFLDACYTGGSQGGPVIENFSPVSVTVALPTMVAGTMTVLMAVSRGQTASWDTTARHGMFTHHLLDALYGKGDADADGRVSAAEAKRYLDRHMTRAARRAYKRHQVPTLLGDGDMPLAFSGDAGYRPRPALGPPPAAFTVAVEPAHARVRILNIGVPYQAGMELEVGSYQVEASAPGYVTRTEMVLHGAAPTMRRIVLPKVGGKFRDCRDCPEMVVVPAGSYWMGSPSWERGRDDDEEPMHEVTFAAPFALGVYEVTVAEFGRFVDETGYRTDAERYPERGCWTMENPTRNKWEYTAGRSWRDLEYEIEGDQPVVCVSWNDAKEYAAWLAENTGMPYRLPSESEWEYAARAESETKYHFGNDEALLCVYGNVADETPLPNGNTWTNGAACSDGAVYPTQVGAYRPNAFGLHDVHGNVREWTEDCWNKRYGGAPGDGAAWKSGDCAKRVLRGGSWNVTPSYLRAANRIRLTTGSRSYNNGFRVARTLSP